MVKKTRADGPHGLIVMDKPIGCSSMDVVRRVRRAAGGARTGHAGTLDPLASGVLICCLGKATRCVDQLMDQTKVYAATVDLSALSATDDAEGELEVVEVSTPPTAAAVRTALDGLTGEIEQVPPVYSAIKVHGKRAYKLARRGEQVTMPPRMVRVDRIEMDRFEWPKLDITVTCGKGTYIRSLGRQIGAALGAGGYLTALRRTAIGDHTIERSVRLDDLPEVLTEGDLISVAEGV